MFLIKTVLGKRYQGFWAYVVRGIADPGKVDVEVVGEGLEHVDLDLVLLGLAVEAVLASNVAEDGVGLGDLELALKPEAPG